VGSNPASPTSMSHSWQHLTNRYASVGAKVGAKWF
jgi:hypothetical protein